MKYPKLSPAEQEQIQSIATRNGLFLSEEQIFRFADYRTKEPFAKVSDVGILYLVMDNEQRDWFDGRTLFKEL